LGVTINRRVVRSKMAVFSLASSLLTCVDSDGCATWHSSAALQFDFDRYISLMFPASLVPAGDDESRRCDEEWSFAMFRKIEIWRDITPIVAVALALAVTVWTRQTAEYSDIQPNSYKQSHEITLVSTLGTAQIGTTPAWAHRVPALPRYEDYREALAAGHAQPWPQANDPHASPGYGFDPKGQNRNSTGNKISSLIL
jgi:hypothetical protein